MAISLVLRLLAESSGFCAKAITGPVIDDSLLAADGVYHRAPSPTRDPPWGGTFHLSPAPESNQPLGVCIYEDAL